MNVIDKTENTVCLSCIETGEAFKLNNQIFMLIANETTRFAYNSVNLISGIPTFIKFDRIVTPVNASVVVDKD